MALAPGMGVLSPQALRARWHRAALYMKFLRRGGRISWDSELSCFVSSKTLPGAGASARLRVAIRSSREFRRWIHFGEGEESVLQHWLSGIGPEGTLWDIGSANGLEGCTAVQLTGCQVVFVEPFTPSIETILKSLVLIARDHPRPRCEVVQAAVGDRPGYGQLIMHTLPVPGETLNSIADATASYGYGGARRQSVGATQWVKFLTLEEMLELGLPPPTHLKIDIDGLEDRALRAATALLSHPRLRFAAIEVNGPTRVVVEETMARHGFNRTNEFPHGASQTFDLYFARA